MGEDLRSTVLSGVWGGVWEETWSLQMLNEEVLGGNRQFLLPELILAVSVATWVQQSLLCFQGRQCYQHLLGRHYTWQKKTLAHALSFTWALHNSRILFFHCRERLSKDPAIPKLLSPSRVLTVKEARTAKYWVPSALEKQRLFSVIINFTFHFILILLLPFNLSQPIQSVLSYVNTVTYIN